MSNSGVRLNPEAPSLSVNPEELIEEWEKLDGLLGGLNSKIKQSNHLIEMGNKTIQECQSQGREILGKLEILARIFKGMGIDPENFRQINEKNPSEILPLDAPEVPELDATVENEEDTPKNKFEVKKFTSRSKKE